MIGQIGDHCLETTPEGTCFFGRPRGSDRRPGAAAGQGVQAAFFSRFHAPAVLGPQCL